MYYLRLSSICSIRQNLRKKTRKYVGIFRRGWVTFNANSDGRGVAHQAATAVGVRKLESDCSFVWYQNIRSALFGFVTKHECDRQTGRQNYDSQDCPNIAASRGNNATISWAWGSQQSRYIQHSIYIEVNNMHLTSAHESED